MTKLIYEEVKPLVNTKYGTLRGTTYGGVNVFLGVKYAAAGRFQMPSAPECWEGIKDANTFGCQCMQMGPEGAGSFENGFGNFVPQSEDCQNLNIWASAKEGGKKPVFVWMHGGGFFSGNSVENRYYEGFNMAKEGDIVFVAVNHRLNLLGYLNLADFGEEFENCKNLGIADLVAALSWIHENIAAFGGDPGNVTICGHSGGGGKVLSMYQIEEAKNLFAKGIVMSGVLDEGPETNEEDSRYLASLMLKELGIGKENISDVYTVPYPLMVKAYKKCAGILASEKRNFGIAPLANDYFKGFPIDVGFCEWSKDKPLMIGTTLAEFNFKVNIPNEKKENITDEALTEMLRGRFGERYAELAGLFEAAYPGHSLLDLMYLDADFRRPSYATAIEKAKTGAKDTFIYMFAYNFPIDVRTPAWHGSDIPYAFGNMDKCPVCNEKDLGEQMGNALFNTYLNFIRCGNPGNEFLPKWEPFTLEHKNTMVIDKTNALKEAYDEDLIRVHREIIPPLNFHPEIF